MRCQVLSQANAVTVYDTLIILGSEGLSIKQSSHRHPQWRVPQKLEEGEIDWERPETTEQGKVRLVIIVSKCTHLFSVTIIRHLRLVKFAKLKIWIEVWWHLPASPEFERLRQENHEFQASLGYIQQDDISGNILLRGKEGWGREGVEERGRVKKEGEEKM